MKFEIFHLDGPGDGATADESPALSYPPESDWYRTPPLRRPVPAAVERPAGKPSAEVTGISKAIRTIHDEYSRPLTVSSLARECGMSVRTLHRLYRSVTGNTIGKDLLARRIEAAADLLREDDGKLEPIAMETGLRSAKNLCRLFKVRFGLTPGQWKETCQRQMKESC
jgi:transcriptional regulator GlxA family with amidase domain